jgi:EcsC protein family
MTTGAPADAFAPAVLDAVARIPAARVRRSAEPADAARRLARTAALKAAATAGALALPTGPLGWLTLLPEMRSVWKIQAQLVADIAALHGRKSELTKEQMLYCLFRHDAAHALRDVVVRVGERFVIRPPSSRLMQRLVREIALQLTQRVLGKGVARWLPVAGAVGVGAYAYHETQRVAAAALELFAAGVDVETTRD